MKTSYLLIVISLAIAISCQSQDLKSAKKQQKGNKPEEKVIVNRKYDEDGNLIEFDSTYTSYYSSIDGDTLKLDSIMQKFNSYFSNRFPGMMSKPYMMVDSMFMPDFFHDDFFEQSFIDKNEQLLRMMKEMDSMKNDFFGREFKSVE